MKIEVKGSRARFVTDGDHGWFYLSRAGFLPGIYHQVTSCFQPDGSYYPFNVMVVLSEFVKASDGTMRVKDYQGRIRTTFFLHESKHLTLQENVQ